MLRGIGALIAALVVWVVVVTVGHRLVCVFWPAYAAATPLLILTLPMKLTRLALGAISTLVAGAVVRRLSPVRWLPFVLGCVLLVMFLPEHYRLWNRFPVWYHLTFLCTLIPLALLGACLPGAKQAQSGEAQFGMTRSGESRAGSN